ncbi:hypothetical protein HT031_002766 [Scenedesmus sp. PABB004]|nr:hypothetical protein HT031_002766 [Scenedesmus sp. PABB004]
MRRGAALAAAPASSRLGAAGAGVRRVVVARAAAGAQRPDAYEALRGKTVFRSSDRAALDLPSLWGPGDKAVVAELAIQLRRDLLPALDSVGVKLFLVSIGTLERSAQFAEATGFPRDRLLADPESCTYEALGLVRGVRQTFFGTETALSFLARMRTPGGMDDIRDVLTRWQVILPPRQEQALQQGGLFVFDGPALVFSHYDQATGAHADLGQVLGLAQRLGTAANAAAAAVAGEEDCGCGPAE